MLQAVILEYIHSGDPVASSTVSKVDGMDLSSATVRNLLHDLEQEGLLTQPHTSAGRVPTDKGYRYYVDYLLGLQEVLEAEQVRIEEEYRKRMGEIESVLSQTSYMLAYLSHHAGFVLKPKLDVSVLQRMELIPCGQGRVLLVLVAKNGLARSRLVDASRDFSEDELRRVSRWVNDSFQGRTFQELCLGFEAQVSDKIEEELRSTRDILRAFMEPVAAMAKQENDGALLLEGAANVLTSPDFSGASVTMRRLADTLENRDEMMALLKKEVERAEAKAHKSVSVVIGREASSPEFKDLAVVARSFETEDHTVGVLGILGPKRMEYGRMVSLVEAVHRALQKALEKLTISAEHGKGGLLPDDAAKRIGPTDNA